MADTITAKQVFEFLRKLNDELREAGVPFYCYTMFDIDEKEHVSVMSKGVSGKRLVGSLELAKTEVIDSLIKGDMK